MVDGTASAGPVAAATRDTVTGLPDRADLIARLEHVLRSATPTTVYQLELDGFRVLSDGLGRATGDELLCAVARRLAGIATEVPEAMVAGLDRGTFAILVESSPTAPDTVTMIRKVNQALAEPVRVADRPMPVSVSVGVVHQPTRDTEPDELMGAAGLALRRAQHKGSGQWAVFDPDHDGRHRHGDSLAATMPSAWHAGQIRVIYRPVCRLADKHVVRVEALPRWDHPEHGPIPHQRCRELAERTGLSLSLGARLLRGAGEQARRGHTVPVCVNLTSHQSRDRNLVGRVMHVLDDSGVPPARL